MSTTKPASNNAFTEELPNSEGLVLMKHFNHTWMPAVETGMPQWIDENGNYQHSRYVRSKQYLSNNRVAIDVGANLGLFARRMAEDFKTVYCFEPVPLARACLARNVNANNCIIYPYGLGKSDYEAEISYCENSIGGSTIGRHANETRPADKQLVEHQIKLHVKPLDSFEFTNVDFIKIDIQGYEYDMLLGAKQTLTENSPVILIELEANKVEHVEVPLFLKSIGYDLRERMGKDGVFVKSSLRSKTKSIFNFAKKSK